MYLKLETLSADSHRHLKLVPQTDYRFAARVAQVPLVQEELAEAAKHFPIVFTRRRDEVQPVALLSLKPDTNVFVDEAGQWRAGYIPAWLRRYPFTFARSATDDDAEPLVVMIDRGAPHFVDTAHAQGQPLFVTGAEAEDGPVAERGPAITKAVDYLSRFRSASRAVEALVAPLAQFDVLTARSLDIYTGERHANRIAGLQIVDRERLHALEDRVLGRWSRNGLLEAVHAHWHSLTNFRRLSIQES